MWPRIFIFKTTSKLSFMLISVGFVIPELQRLILLLCTGHSAPFPVWLSSFGVFWDPSFEGSIPAWCSVLLIDSALLVYTIGALVWSLLILLYPSTSSWTSPLRKSFSSSSISLLLLVDDNINTGNTYQLLPRNFRTLPFACPICWREPRGAFLIIMRSYLPPGFTSISPDV